MPLQRSSLMPSLARSPYPARGIQVQVLIKPATPPRQKRGVHFPPTPLLRLVIMISPRPTPSPSHVPNKYLARGRRIAQRNAEAKAARLACTRSSTPLTTCARPLALSVAPILVPSAFVPVPSTPVSCYLDPFLVSVSSSLDPVFVPVSPFSELSPSPESVASSPESVSFSPESVSPSPEPSPVTVSSSPDISAVSVSFSSDLSPSPESVSSSPEPSLVSVSSSLAPSSVSVSPSLGPSVVPVSPLAPSSPVTSLAQPSVIPGLALGYADDPDFWTADTAEFDEAFAKSPVVSCAKVAVSTVQNIVCPALRGAAAFIATRILGVFGY